MRAVGNAGRRNRDEATLGNVSDLNQSLVKAAHQADQWPALIIYRCWLADVGRAEGVAVHDSTEQWLRSRTLRRHICEREVAPATTAHCSLCFSNTTNNSDALSSVIVEPHLPSDRQFTPPGSVLHPSCLPRLSSSPCPTFVIVWWMRLLTAATLNWATNRPPLVPSGTMVAPLVSHYASQPSSSSASSYSFHSFYHEAVSPSSIMNRHIARRALPLLPLAGRHRRRAV